jgi:hypothetical protein
MKGELNTRLIYECRCDERLKAKDERSTLLTYSPPGFEKVPSEMCPLVLTKSKATCEFAEGRYLRARKDWVRSEDGLINRTSMIAFNQNCLLVSPSGRQLPDVVCFIATQKSVWSIQSNRTCDLSEIVMFQGHRYLGVPDPRRTETFVSKRRHPDSQNPHL